MPVVVRGGFPNSVSEPIPEPAIPLLEAARKAGTSGLGMDLLASRTASPAARPYESHVGFQ
eukprot:9477930-Pyramimonas_sp.AAC.1